MNNTTDFFFQKKKSPKQVRLKTKYKNSTIRQEARITNHGSYKLDHNKIEFNGKKF